MGGGDPWRRKGPCSVLYQRFGIKVLCSIKPAHKKLRLWDHSILKVSSVFFEMLWPCRLLSQCLLWMLFFLQTISCQVCHRLLSLVSNLFYWCCIFLQLFPGRTKDCHCIVFHLQDGVVLALCVAHVQHFFPTQCWQQPRVFLNPEVPAASGQPANIPQIPLVISVPVCTCWALRGIWILPATPDKALLP